ncbi:MAG: hypothetical protein QXZ30_01850 [Candidatus Bilamarchaeaceae archaeon]
MERKISIYLYVIAFIFASILFAVGVYVGTLINQNVMSSLASEIEEANTKISNIGVLLFLEDQNSNFCSFYKEELTSFDREREKLGYELSLMEDQKGYSSPEIKRKYMVLQIQSLLFSKKVQKLCGEDYCFVLFFYDNVNCTDCKRQGEIILKARDSFSTKDKIKIYAFDTGINSSVVHSLMKEYNVNAIPMTIIGNYSYVGIVSLEELKQAMKDADRD